ncbi:hypothetical protein OA07_16275 [Aphanizomenon flos-aquae 2012/KM1/D3]|uniref:hypothetical protein n=1 Tax=Aphanizomenon flos-aquae TaxID=1176 RepID=UPI0005433AE2|nr:hypothetical protein [Aphanizomenon flos-aquae]KHG40667.1 hypothetical protein OA07_16275 [Aphanizomenon flos-aquae 2012/KM1/D3]
MANATLRYQEVGAQVLRPFRSMANATLRYQEVGAQGLRPFRSKKKEGKKKIKQSPITNYQLPKL